ncbi:CBM35 domain-containing protein [Streptomyces sannanensis]|uniref:CBM35 domain-containing protein n=1 Tax=Streptomyces sannanensis TaxID=285536 RepID=A0ABP6SBM3_9ACTN
MTTPGDNGASATPEDDDPFGYLYADGQAAGAAPPSSGGYGYPRPAQPGVPRTSYNQVRTVGQHQYGQQPYGQQPYGQPQVPQQQPYGGQNPQYAAPETYPGGAPTRQVPVPEAGGRGRGRGPNTKGLLIGAVAVVAAVVIGIGVALSTSGGDEDKRDQAGTSAGPAGGDEPSQEPSAGPTQSQPSAPAELPKGDAATLQLSGGATTDKTIPGAKSASGAYVLLNSTPGAAATWNVEIPESGKYTLFIDYSVPGKDGKTHITVNGEPPRKVNMSNFAQAADGAWDKGWTYTYSYVTLAKGPNTFKLSCEPGDQCEVALDQLSLKKGEVKP